MDVPDTMGYEPPADETEPDIGNLESKPLASADPVPDPDDMTGKTTELP